VAEPLCTKPGICSFSPNCTDKHCPGRIMAMEQRYAALHRVTPIRTVNGGESVLNGRPLRIERLEEPAPFAADELTFADHVLVATLCAVALFAAWSPFYF
jgi:hypothetical protein